MPARSTRSPRASCRSRSARRPRPCPSSMDGRKAYVFTVDWGAETDTDDAEGEVVRDPNAPGRAAIEALLPRFTGTIEQVPPRFSAIKIAGRARLRSRPRRRGRRARGRARSTSTGSTGRSRHADDRGLSRPNAARAPMCARSPATWAGALGCLGHVAALRRARGRSVRRGGRGSLVEAVAARARPRLRPVEAALFGNCPAIGVAGTWRRA